LKKENIKYKTFEKQISKYEKIFKKISDKYKKTTVA
jgi:hypothetical protein